jgi:hypothetical protein
VGLILYIWVQFGAVDDPNEVLFLYCLDELLTRFSELRDVVLPVVLREGDENLDNLDLLIHQRVE